MKFHNGIEGLELQKPVITIGMFDGVHLGHKTVLQKVVERSCEVNGESVLLSFWPHPRVLFEGEKTALRILNSIEEKKENLEKLGIDHFILYPFSLNFAKTSPQQYVESILVNGLHVHTVIIGYDHRFGHKGAGDFMLMKKLGLQFNFAVEQIAAFEVEQMNVSSTIIRQSLEQGDIISANTYLSYNYSIRGSVVPGNKIGRQLGFPTANVLPDDRLKLIPKNGVYIVRLKVKNTWYDAVASIGIRPTIDTIKREHAIEVHMLDYAGDIYGEQVILSFNCRIRDEEKFDSIAELKKYIAADVEKAKEYFKNI